MNSLFEKLFLTRSYFTIAIRSRSANTVLSDPRFVPNYIHPATSTHWCADPILAEQDGKTWLFYEAVENDHGHIEFAEVLPDCSLGTPTVLLKDECHYSYPFVFQWDGSWYMIPESSAAREVRLYRAEHFPDRWSLREVLLRERAVDTTVFAWEGQLYLLTFLTDGSTEQVTPLAYTLKLQESGSSLVPLPWSDFDRLLVRGAGPLLEQDGTLYRPAQRNRFLRYGDGVIFYRFQPTKDAYRETPVGSLAPQLGKHSGLYLDGTHTYCRSSQFEAIDLRCRDFDLLKLPKRLLSHLQK